MRELEFLYPSGAFRKIGGEAIYPYVESQYRLMKPLVTLFDEGKIPAPDFDVSAAHRLNTGVSSPHVGTRPLTIGRRLRSPIAIRDTSFFSQTTITSLKS